VVIGVGTSLRKCVAHGVVPDITVALESNDILGQFRGIDEIREGYTVFQIKCHPELWDVPARGTYFYGNVHPDTGWLMRLLDEPDPFLATGGSVSTAAFSLAVALGCNPIVLIGQDLAYGEAGQSHAEGIGTGGVEDIKREEMEYTREHDTLAKKNLCLVDGYFGKQVVTKTNLRNYLLWFEQVIPQVLGAGFRVINSTEGGAKIAGAEQMPFAEATDQLLGDPVEVISVLDEKRQPSAIDYPKVLEKLERTQAELRELIKLAEKGKEKAIRVQKLMNRRPQPVDQINHLIRQIDRDEKRVRELLTILADLLTVVAVQALLVIRSCFDYEGLDREETVRMNMKQTATMYNALVDAYKFILAVLEPFAKEVEEKRR
ncbi:MAG: motility associated factor glycosyltransferase family protein, partial [Alphaproteobacteria bacterium]